MLREIIRSLEVGGTERTLRLLDVFLIDQPVLQCLGPVGGAKVPFQPLPPPEALTAVPALFGSCGFPDVLSVWLPDLLVLSSPSKVCQHGWSTEGLKLT
jgi:hypothetical protein